MTKKANHSSRTKLKNVLDHPSFERLMGDVIHKMKNNLGGISGFATLLSRDLGEESPHLRLLEQIQSSVVRLDELAVDLMVLIRKIKLTTEKVYVQPMLTDLIHQYEEHSGIQCRTRYRMKSKNEKFMIHADSYTISRFFKYIIKFAECTEGRLNEIIMSHPAPESSTIEVSIRKPDVQIGNSNDLCTLIDEDETVEKRLIWVIIVKLAQSVNGRMKVQMHPDGRMAITVEIGEESIHE